MKDYISRLNSGCKGYVFVFWWVMRIAVTACFISSFFTGKIDFSGQLHMAVCLGATFFWEMAQATPKKSLFRFIPSSIHTFMNIGLFLSAVLGIYFDFYCTVRLFDPLLQGFFGFISVLYGYEIAYAMVKRDRFSATKAMVFFVAFGVGFILFNVWELSEFFFDQLMGYLTGKPGNSQFWSQALAEGTARAESLIDPLVAEREPIISLMVDVFVHSVSSFIALIFINIYPYRLRGKYKYDIEYNNNNVE